MINRCEFLSTYGLRRERIGGEIETGEKDSVGDAAAAFTATAGQNDIVFIGRSRGVGDLLPVLVLFPFMLFRGIVVLVTELKRKPSS
jgi:hypothetical protein